MIRQLKAALRASALGIVSVCALAAAPAALANGGAHERDGDCPDGREITLVNGRIHTMDGHNRVVSTLTIRNGKFASVGHDDGGAGRFGCRQVINLRGRTVTPGLVDNHNHIVLLGLRPGHHTPLESAASFADIAATYRHRIAALPAGAFITSIGGFNPVQFAEKRLPTLAELDAISSGNPLYMQVAFIGPSTTNSAGKAFFASRGIAVGADGSIAAGAATVAALNALRSVQTFDDKKRGTRDAMAYAAALGVTTHFDMGGFLIPGSPNHEDEFVFDGAASWDPYTAYDPILELHRNGEMKVRVRVFFLSMDNAAATPILTRRLDNAFRDFGNDWLRIAGLGEFITNWPLFGVVSTPSNYPAAVRKAAERGWIYSQHTLTSAEDEVVVSNWEAAQRHGADRAAALVDRACGDDHTGAPAAPEGHRCRRGGARFSLPRGHAHGQRPAVPHHRRQRHPGGRGFRLGADLGAEPMADALLHDHRQEQLGRADQRRADADAPRGAAPVHARERLVQQRGRQARLDRGRQAGRPHGAECRLLQRAGRSAEATRLGAHHRRRARRAQQRRAADPRTLRRVNGPARRGPCAIRQRPAGP